MPVRNKSPGTVAFTQRKSPTTAVVRNESGQIHSLTVLFQQDNYNSKIMQKQYKSRLSKRPTVSETLKFKQVRIPQLAVTFINRVKPNGRDIIIYCRLTYNGQRLQFSTDLTCKRKDFDTKTITIQGQPEQTALLTTIKANALKAAAQYERSGNLSTWM